MEVRRKADFESICESPVFELQVRAPGNKFLAAKIDTADLPKVFAFSRRWRATFDGDSQTYYVKSQKNGKTKSLHRLITDAPTGMTVDHIDHDGLNNTRKNLRVVPQRINSLNRRESRGQSGYRGVYRKDGKWRASVMVNRKRVLLGSFTDPKLASSVVEQFIAETRSAN